MDVIIYRMSDNSARVWALKHDDLQYADKTIRDLVNANAPELEITNALEVLAEIVKPTSEDDVTVSSWRLANFTELPSGTFDGKYDTYFRGALVDDGNAISIDMEKAKAIQMANIRVARNSQFIQLGFPTRLNPELEAAIISKPTQEALQALRDIPQTVNLSVATTPDELKIIGFTEIETIVTPIKDGITAIRGGIAENKGE